MTPPTLCKVALALAACALLCSPLAAQAPIWTWYGDTAYDGLGRSVSDIGDLNGDGFDEVLAGAPWDDAIAQDAGMVRIFDGALGTVRNTIYDGRFLDEFGTSVSGAGDVNNDGTPDFIVGVPYKDTGGNGRGSAVVYSGSNYAILHTVNGSADKDILGISVSDVGDVDGDGFDDFAAGAYQYIPGINPGSGRGYVRVYSGLTGAIIYDISGDNDLDFFGYSISGVGDVTNDGVPDFAVGAYGDDNNFNGSGSVRVFNGATGAAVYTVDGDSGQDRFGISVSGAGDVNNDGFPDIIVGAENDKVGGVAVGSARVISGPTGATLYTFYGDAAGDLFGRAVSGVGDVNSDGYDDVLVGARHHDAYGDNSGLARMFSGVDGSVLFTVYGDAGNDLFGFAVSGAGDVNNDGVPDFVVGASQYNAGPGPGNGYARVFDATKAPPPPPPRWPVLPSTFVAVGNGYSDDFESYGGVVPSHFGVNELHALIRQFDPEAWCNIGQRGPCTAGTAGIFPNSGSYDLEMGGDPAGTSNYNKSNGLVIGLDGTGSGPLLLDFMVANLGEEGDTDDGVWLSNDGLNWEQVYTSWTSLPLNTWTAVTDVDLSSTSVNTNGQFYLLFAQSDNFQIGNGDGILIDDIVVRKPSAGLTLSLTGSCPGPVSLTASNATPGGNVAFLYAFGQGSITIPSGNPCAGTTLGLDFTVTLGAVRSANASGTATLPATAPPRLCGRVWLQALDLSSCNTSNVLSL